MCVCVRVCFVSCFGFFVYILGMQTEVKYFFFIGDRKCLECHPRRGVSPSLTQEAALLSPFLKKICSHFPTLSAPQQ